MPDNTHDSKYFISITGEMWIFTVCLSCVCVGGGGVKKSVLGSILLDVPVFTIHALTKCKEDIVSTFSIYYIHSLY